MLHRTAARLHARLLSCIARVLTRLRTAPERGQGTVEYVALILLVAGVLAVAVGAAGKAHLDLAGIVSDNLKRAVEQVSGGGK